MQVPLKIRYVSGIVQEHSRICSAMYASKSFVLGGGLLVQSMPLDDNADVVFVKRQNTSPILQLWWQFTAPTHTQLQSSPLGRRYTSASVRITSGITAGSPFSQPPVRPLEMLLSLLMYPTTFGTVILKKSLSG
ncbi:hypothetical protein TNCV_2363441 [Trichonephila clavipes]|nr:hypothetical protein TNCV_2363441 [Trichonephila clavipes]